MSNYDHIFGGPIAEVQISLRGDMPIADPGAEVVDGESFADRMARQSLAALNDDWRKK